MTPRKTKHRIKELFAPLMLPIRGGPLRGLRWSVATGLPFLRGTYEPGKVEAMTEYLRPGDVVYDVGAHVGYFTAVASRLVGPEGRVLAFEPRPLNLGLLRRHVERNGLENVRVLDAAVGDTAGEGRFRDDTGSGTGHLTTGDGIPVRVVVLDDLVRRGELPPPTAIKVDVEGGETAVLRGAESILADHRPTLFLATHGDAVERECLAMIEGLGYRWRYLDGRKEDSDTEMVAFVEGRTG